MDELIKFGVKAMQYLGPKNGSDNLPNLMPEFKGVFWPKSGWKFEISLQNAPQKLKQVAVIFNPNSELVKSHQTETRFHLNFYPVVEHQAWVEQTKIVIDANVSKKEDVFSNEDDGWYTW